MLSIREIDDFEGYSQLTQVILLKYSITAPGKYRLLSKYGIFNEFRFLHDTSPAKTAKITLLLVRN